MSTAVPASPLKKTFWTLGTALVVLVLAAGTLLALIEADVMPPVVWHFRSEGSGVAAWPLLLWWLAVLAAPLVLLGVLRRWLLRWRAQQLVAGCLVLALGGALLAVFVDGRHIGGVLWAPTLDAEAHLNQALKTSLQHATGGNAEVLCGVLLEDAQRSEPGYFFSPQSELLFVLRLDASDVLDGLDYDQRHIDKRESLVPAACRAQVLARYPRD